jgi:hypothetical protein
MNHLTDMQNVLYSRFCFKRHKCYWWFNEICIYLILYSEEVKSVWSFTSTPNSSSWRGTSEQGKLGFVIPVLHEMRYF